MREAIVRAVPENVRAGGKAALRGWGTITGAFRPLPDFLIIGTKRGGTTSLWNWMLQHPDVLPMRPSMQNLKSSHFFYQRYDRDLHWYRGHFPTAINRRAHELVHGSQPVSGEASPYYLFDPRVAARVHAVVPSVKLVVLLRDPVERAYSHYRERVHEGVEPLDFGAALEAEPARLQGELDRMMSDPLYYSRPHDWFSYRSRGVYEPQLKIWQQEFPASQMLIVRSEDLYQQPTATFAQVSAFIGLREWKLKEVRRYNYHPSTGIDAAVRRELANFYVPHNVALYRRLERDMGW